MVFTLRMATVQQMARVATALLLLAPAGEASYRKHAEFKPADVPTEAARFLKTAVEQQEWWPGRRILVRKTGQGIHFHLKDNGSFLITLDISLQYKGKGPSTFLIDGIEERKTMGSRPLENPSFEWSLDDQTQKEIENMVNTPKHGIFRFEVKHTELVSTAKGEPIQTRTRVEMTAWTPEKALEIITLYFSKFPAETTLWEDDG